MRRVSHWASMVCIALAPFAATAQSMSDPTRPPSADDLARFGSSGIAGLSSEYRLDAVILSQGRKLAVINGQTVPLGEKIGEARLVRVTESGAVIRKDDGTETLRFHAGVEKTPTKRGSTDDARLRSRRMVQERGGQR